MDAEIDEGYVSEAPSSENSINLYHLNEVDEVDEGFFEESDTEEYVFEDQFEWDDEQFIFV